MHILCRRCVFWWASTCVRACEFVVQPSCDRSTGAMLSQWINDASLIRDGQMLFDCVQQQFSKGFFRWFVPRAKWERGEKENDKPQMYSPKSTAPFRCTTAVRNNPKINCKFQMLGDALVDIIIVSLRMNLQTRGNSFKFDSFVRIVQWAYSSKYAKIAC